MAEANLDGNGHLRREKRNKHYSNFHRILLVGEGDFSFAACLARRFGSAVNMVATSLDLRGGTVLHEVDAHTMSKHPILKHKCFDQIVYNFPHAGFYRPEPSLLQIELHRDLVRGCLKNAKTMVTVDGEIHVRHKTAHPYSKWEIEKLAEEQGLFLVDEVPFSVWDYQGNVNQRGSGAKHYQTFPIGEASTYNFSKNDHGMHCTGARLPEECENDARRGWIDSCDPEDGSSIQQVGNREAGRGTRPVFGRLSAALRVRLSRVSQSERLRCKVSRYFTDRRSLYLQV